MDREEIKYILITSAVLGFCFSFRDWGQNAFDINTGFRNLIITSILVLISITIHEIAHRKIGDKYNAQISFKTWNSLLFGALLITILTDGYIVFSAIWVVGISTKHLLRPRHTYPHLGPWESAKIAATGPVTSLAFGLLAALIAFETNNIIWHKLMIINLSFAVFNIVPFFRIIPALMGGSTDFIHNISYKISKHAWQNVKQTYMEGELVFFGSRTISIFLMTLIFVTSFLVLTSKAVFASLMIGIFAATGIYVLAEWFTPFGTTHDSPEPIPEIKLKEIKLPKFKLPRLTWSKK
jgi:hypothetical protein